jgi:hypothetical protein
MNSEFIANVFISVTLIATFIGIFFFTVAAKIEQDIVKNQTKALVKDLVQYKVYLPESSKLFASIMVDNLKAPNMEAADAEAKASNSALLKKATKLIVMGNILAILAVGGLYMYQKFDILHLLKENLFILFFVGLTELMFLVLIGRSYITADPNYVKYYLVKTINEVIQGKM